MSPRMKKIYIVPNIVTTLNMLCGFYSVIAAIGGDFRGASWAILAAAVFDMLDGRIARLAKATSSFGVEYDSLSDLISFGLAPAVLLYLWTLEPFGRLGWLAAFLYLACGALRLARFNVMTQSIPAKWFQGLPIPIAANAIATYVIFTRSDLIEGWIHHPANQWITLGMLLLLGSLMVSTIRFPSFKELNWRSSASFGYLMIGVLVLILVAVRPEVTLFLLLLVYIAASLAMNLVMAVRGEDSPAEASASHR